MTKTTEKGAVVDLLTTMSQFSRPGTIRHRMMSEARAVNLPMGF